MQRQHHGQPHKKTRLAGLVVEQPHPRQAAQRAPCQGKAQQGGLRDAPALAHRLPFVDAESRKGGQVDRRQVDGQNLPEHMEHCLPPPPQGLSSGMDDRASGAKSQGGTVSMDKPCPHMVR